MKKILFIITILLCITFSCEQANKNEANLFKINTISTDSKDTLTHSASNKPDYIVFGRFCGECGGECATMYKFDVVNNKLFVDHTDSYWKYNNGEPMTFATAVTDAKAIASAKELLNNLPDFIVTAEKEAERFGCPDCTDGCGLFFEIKKGNAVHKFYIDNQTKNLEGNVKSFAEELQRVIGKM